MILGTSCMIWGRSGMILKCRITVCNYSVAPSIQKSQLSTLISCIYTRTLQCISHVLSSDRSTSFTSLLNSDWKNMPICSLCFNNLPFTCTFISVLPERDTKREDILKQIWNVGNKILRPSNNKHITAPAKSGHHTTFIISKSKVQIWAHWPPFFGLFACFQRYLERCFYSAGQTHYYQNQIWNGLGLYEGMVWVLVLPRTFTDQAMFICIGEESLLWVGQSRSTLISDQLVGKYWSISKKYKSKQENTDQLTEVQILDVCMRCCPAWAGFTCTCFSAPPNSML